MKPTESSSLQEQLAAEQSFLDQAYHQLDTQHDYYQEQLLAVRARGASGTPGARSERDSFATHYEDNLARLRNVESRLVLGSLDFIDGRNIHIGRITLRDSEKNVVLTDWRAPQSTAFYQATPLHQMDVYRRRHIQTRLRKVLGIEDELLTSGENNSELGLTGEAALFAAMTRARDGKMNDIVATIQREQDQIIRADINGVLVVQGGPGTGKTAVALHRAAYLLYTYREQLARSGVLIIGPSERFIQYIDQVLPALGETNVVATTISALLPGFTANTTDAAHIAEIKGRDVWAKVARRARNQILQKRPQQDFSFRIGSTQVSLSKDDIASAQERAKQTHLPHNEAREKYAKYLVSLLSQRVATARNVTLNDDDWITNDVASDPEVRRVINLHWLPASAAWLYSHLRKWPELLIKVAPELTAVERELLFHPNWLQDAKISAGDIAILDEFTDVLGEVLSNSERRRQSQELAESNRLENYVAETMDEMNLGQGIVNSQRILSRIEETRYSGALSERAATDRQWTYGHVVIDEAQELSPMQWRMITRRNPVRSMTVVGDLDQRMTGDQISSWNQLLPNWQDYLRVERLTVSYRTPQEILDYAAEQMKLNGTPVAPITAPRSEPTALTLKDGAKENFNEVLTQSLKKETEFLNSEYGEGFGTIAVICPEHEISEITEAIAELGQKNFTEDRLSILTAREAKGLEYDVCIVIHPDEIAKESHGNYYVALTRATKRLTVLK